MGKYAIGELKPMFYTYILDGTFTGRFALA